LVFCALLKTPEIRGKKKLMLTKRIENWTARHWVSRGGVRTGGNRGGIVAGNQSRGSSEHPREVPMIGRKNCRIPLGGEKANQSFCR